MFKRKNSEKKKTFGAKKTIFWQFFVTRVSLNKFEFYFGWESVEAWPRELGLVGSMAHWFDGSLAGARWLGLVGWGSLAEARWLGLAGSGSLARARWLAPKLRLAVKKTKGLSLTRLIFFWKLGLKQPLNQKVQKVGFTIKLFVCHLGTAGSC